MPPKIGQVLAHVGYSIRFGQAGTKDEDLIPWMGDNNLTWISKDDKSKWAHEKEIRDAGISIVWLRGLTHAKRGKITSIEKHPNMKQVLKMLVDQLDRISEEVARANGPRYFILFIRRRKIAGADVDNAEYSTHTTLKEVHERLAGA
ncbi:MAG: hypothetical protein O2854_07675 [Chloroflexi bacterium]|nr:hypothetical protein [Chloroflexota bacterium]